MILCTKRDQKHKIEYRLGLKNPAGTPAKLCAIWAKFNRAQRDRAIMTWKERSTPPRERMKNPGGSPFLKLNYFGEKNTKKTNFKVSRHWLFTNIVF